MLQNTLSNFLRSYREIPRIHKYAAEALRTKCLAKTKDLINS